MASKTFQPNRGFELPNYPTIPPIDFEDVERAQVRGRELQAQAVREAFSGWFRSIIDLLRGTRRLGSDGRKDPLATSNPV